MKINWLIVAISVNNDDSHILIKPQKITKLHFNIWEMSKYSLKSRKGCEGHQMKFISEAFHFFMLDVEIVHT